MSEYSDDDDVFPFADKPDAAAAAAAKAAEAAEDAEDAKWESERPLPLVTSALISFAKATLKPHTTDSTTRATRIVDKVMETHEKQK
jgi:hypothetical protein